MPSLPVVPDAPPAAGRALPEEGPPPRLVLVMALAAGALFTLAGLAVHAAPANRRR